MPLVDGADEAASESGAVEEPSERLSPLPRTGRPAASNAIIRILFFLVVPLLLCGLVLYMAIRLDRAKKPVVQLEGGEIHRFTDGLVAVQDDPNSDKKVYYVVEAPREAEARIEFGDRTMTLFVRTEAGIRDISRSVQWVEAPYVMLINYVDLYGETPKIPCSPASIEDYLEATGEEDAVAPLAIRLRKGLGPSS